MSFGPGRSLFGPQAQGKRKPRAGGSCRRRTEPEAQAGGSCQPLAEPSESFWGPEITAAIEAERARDRERAEFAAAQAAQLAQRKAARRARLDAFLRERREEGR